MAGGIFYSPKYLNEQGQSNKQTSGSTSGQSSSTSGPLGELAPFYQDLWARASGALQGGMGYSGDFVATPTPWAGQGIAALGGAVPMIGQGAGDFLNMAQATARGDFLRPESNPFLAAAAQAMIRPVQQGLTEHVLPNIKDASIAQGAYGGSRQDVQENQAARDFDTAALDATARLYANNYEAERQRQMQSGGLLSQGYGLAAAPGQFMLGIDEAQRGLNQLSLNNNLAKVQNPFSVLGQAGGIFGLGGFGTQTGTQSGTSSGMQTGTEMVRKDNPNYEDPFTKALKMAIGGGSAIATAGGKGGLGLWGAK